MSQGKRRMLGSVCSSQKFLTRGARASRQSGTRISFYYLILTTLLALLPVGAAQTLRVGFTGSGGAFGLEPSLVVRDLSAGRLGLELRAARGRTGALEFGLGVGSKTSFGPVGTVALRGILQLDTTGAFEGTVAGDGAVASVAARFGLSVFNVNPGRFGALNALGYEVGHGDAVVDGYGAFGAISGLSRPPVAGASPSWGVFGHLGASYRLNRRTVLELDPSLLYVRGGVGVGLQGAVQVRRLRGRDDGAVRVATLLNAGAEAGLGGSYGAAGFEYRYNPPTGPLLRGSLWLGAGSRGVGPGARVEGVQNELNATLRYGLALAAEPYRTDAPPYRLEASLQSAAGPGTLNLRLLGAAGAPASYPAPRFVIHAFYDVPF